MCLFVSLLARLYKYYQSDFHAKKTRLSPTQIPLFFKSDPDHGLDTKIITDSDFPIYLSLGHLKNSHMLWRRYSLTECSCIKIEFSLLICLLPFAVLQYFEH